MTLDRRQFSMMALAAPMAACAHSGAGAEPAWRQGAPAPYAVQEIYPALYRGGVWIAGGFSPEAGGATARVIVFDPARNVWRDGPALPEPAHHVHLAVLDDRLYAIGGYLGGDTGLRWIATPRVLKLSGETWIEAPALPRPIGEAIPLVLDGRIHLIGGRSPRSQANAVWGDQVDVDEHVALAAGASAWERAAPLPMARNSHGGAVFGGELHVVSGRTVASGQTSAYHIFDPRSGAWREGPAFPEPRGGLAACVWRGRLVAGGGEIFEPGSVGRTLYELDGDWKEFAVMPTPRHGHAMVAEGDALYVLGGAERVGGDGALKTVDVLA